MRKINNRNEFQMFVDDVRSHARFSPLVSDDVHFGLSQDGDNIDSDTCAYMHDFGVGYIIPRLVFSDDCGGIVTAEEFVEGVEGNYSYPFYIVDIGDNYTWL